jgi:hypothetical protein
MSDRPSATKATTAIEEYGDNFIPVIPSDYMEHTLDLLPFCWDSTCPCHEDPDAIAEIHQAYQDGLITTNDATRMVEGRTV